MAKTRGESLPKAWTNTGWSERREALNKLTPAVRKLLAMEWARAAVEDARRVLSIWEKQYPDDPRPRLAIEAADNVIAGTDDAAYAAYASAYAYAAYASAYAYASASASASAEKSRWRWMYAMYRHAHGPRFPFSPAWRTSTAVSIARYRCTASL